MSALSRIIAEEIRLKGPVSLARFMELALYCPEYGYYERDPHNIGARGDFQTSVSVGPMFGELLAAQFAGWLDQLCSSGRHELHVVEAGAHDGQLSFDVISWLCSKYPDLMNRVKFHLVEPSQKRLQWQKTKLADFADHIVWCSSLDELKRLTGGVCGIIFSNEILDAFPVHRFVWDKRQQSWHEMLVSCQGESFVWERSGGLHESHQKVIRSMVSDQLCEVIPDGHIIEYSRAAMEWWKQAAEVLQCGWLLTFDYGIDAEGLIPSGKGQGTLRGYRNHQVVEDVLSNPGEQDITAHVRFDLIQKVGEACGLQTEFLGEQGRYLVGVAEHADQSRLSVSNWTTAQKNQFKTLIHPEHFGHSFKAFLQSKL